jgi:hypothetical protein
MLWDQDLILRTIIYKANVVVVQALLLKIK